MANASDDFEVLYRPVAPLAPPHRFATDLRQRIEQELEMTVTQDPSARAALDGTLAMVHLKVGDADRAMAFFGELCGWESERFAFDGHTSHYVLNSTVTLRILDDPDAPAVTPNYRVTNVAHAIDAIRASGGTIIASETAPDGGGWAQGRDDQDVPLLVFRPHDRSHRVPAREASAEVGLVFIREDIRRARDFYGTVFGWSLQPGHPGSWYFEAVPGVGIFDEAAAFNRHVDPSVTLYISVEELGPMLDRVQQLGGHAGPAAQDMGPYFTAICRDDQGTEFGLMSHRW